MPNHRAVAPSIPRRHGREMRNGTAVYVKRYELGAAPPNAGEVVRARIAQEVELLRRLNEHAGNRSRLGVARVVEADPQAGQLAVEEIPGHMLEEFLLRARGAAAIGSGTRAVFLAGRWLRMFQSLEAEVLSEPAASDEPLDLVEYCRRRLERLTRLESRWPAGHFGSSLLARIGQWSAHRSEADRCLVCAHGDYAPVNMIWDGKRLTPIDFEMCRLEVPLVDVTYFVHRLEMWRLQFPWKCLPIETWSAAFLRGYGHPQAPRSAVYRPMMVRHLLNRLVTLTSKPGATQRARWHGAWIRFRVQARLAELLGEE